MKSIITVSCPECGGSLEIDVAAERVLSHKLNLGADDPKKDKAAMFDDVVERVRRRQEDSVDAFDEALKEVEGSQDRIDELFGDIKKRIKEEKEKGDDGEEDPRNLFWD